MNRTSKVAIAAGATALMGFMTGTTPAWAGVQEDYIASVSAIAQRMQAEYDLPASVAVGQSALESRWGDSGLTRSDKNYFGIKCTSPTSPGPIAVGCVQRQTSECLPTCGPATAWFRSYRSAEDSFRDWGRMITSSANYASALPYRHDPDRFIIEVAKRYATDNTGYAGKVIKIMRDHNLYGLDSGQQHPPRDRSVSDVTGDGFADLLAYRADGQLLQYDNNILIND
uniref:glucosaminidase domain-containing protein n=1 Tax=Nonomuraea candida TaxID=359159 RepID=UPI0006943CFB